VICLRARRGRNRKILDKLDQKIRSSVAEYHRAGANWLDREYYRGLAVGWIEAWKLMAVRYGVKGLIQKYDEYWSLLIGDTDEEEVDEVEVVQVNGLFL